MVDLVYLRRAWTHLEVLQKLVDCAGVSLGLTLNGPVVAVLGVARHVKAIRLFDRERTTVDVSQGSSMIYYWDSPVVDTLDIALNRVLKAMGGRVSRCLRRGEARHALRSAVVGDKVSDTRHRSVLLPQCSREACAQALQPSVYVRRSVHKVIRF